MKAEKIKGHLDLVLLAVLGDGPGHGYRLITQLQERTGGAMELQEGSVYPALHRLEQAGLLSSGWEPGPNRRRRVYRLTASGRKALSVERREWTALVSAIDGVLRPAVTTVAGRS